MNQALISSFILVLSGAAASPVFYNQRESLYIDRETPTVNLMPYFETRPLAFGLVSNKTRSEKWGGYLCFAEDFDQYLSKCRLGSRLKNADWVCLKLRLIFLVDCDPSL
jgi:hypothetical protein